MPGATSGFSPPLPSTCLVLRLEGFGIGPWPEPLQLLPLPPPAVRTFEVPENFEEQLEQQRIGPTTQLLTHADFPLQAYEPKVQVPYLVLPGQCPRKIEIERYGMVGCGRACPPGGGGAQLRGEGQQAISDHPCGRSY